MVSEGMKDSDNKAGAAFELLTKEDILGASLNENLLES